jgi:hypothetical protein
MPHTEMLSAFDAVAWTTPDLSGVAYATSAPGMVMASTVAACPDADAPMTSCIVEITERPVEESRVGSPSRQGMVTGEGRAQALSASTSPKSF